MWVYFDTSALVKRYVDEAGRRDVLQLFREHECVVSAVLPVELQSAVRRRKSEGSINLAGASEILKRFTADRVYWTAIEVSSGVLDVAETLAARYPVRTLDAIHVASAQLFAGRVSAARLLFVSADERQTNTALDVGLTARLIG